MKRHLWYMAGGAVLVLAVLLVAGVGLGQATRYALALACPLGMVAMMVVMGKGAGHRHGSADGGETGMTHEHGVGHGAGGRGAGDHSTGGHGAGGVAGGQVDPVCGMTVDPARAAATRERDGVRYFFCATGCATSFDTEPARYLRSRARMQSAANSTRVLP